MPAQKYLTIKEAASYLNVSTKTLRRWEASGKITTERTRGGHRRYLIADLHSFRRTHHKPSLIHGPVSSSFPTVAKPIEVATPKIFQPYPEVVAAQEPLVREAQQPVFAEYPPQLVKPLRIKTGRVVKTIRFTVLAVVAALVMLNSNALNSAKEAIGVFRVSVGTEKTLIAENDAQVLASRDTLLSAEFNVNVDANFKQDASVEGDLNLVGNTIVASSDLLINAIGGGVSIGNGVAASVDLEDGDLFVSGDSEFNGDLFAVNTSLSGNLSVALDAEVTGDVTAGSFTLNGDAVTDFTGTGITLVNGALTASVSPLGDSIDTNEIADGTITEVDLNASNSPTSGYALTYNSSTNAFTWTDIAGSIVNAWSDSGTLIALTTTTDNVSIGGSTDLGKLAVDGDADETQLLIQGNATQTANLAVFEQSDGTNVVTIDNSGNIVLATGADLTIGLIGLNDTATASGATLIGVDNSSISQTTDTNLQDVLEDLSASIGSGSSKWSINTTPNPDVIYPTNSDTTAGLDVAFGGTSSSAPFYFDVSTASFTVGVNESLNGGLTLYSSGAGITDALLATDASGNVNVTIGTNGLLNVLAGNLKVGDASPTQSLNGEDAYVEGSFELDGILYAGSGSEALTLATGKIDSDALTLATGTTFAPSATNSNVSGLEVVSDSLSLLRGCTAGQVLKWDTDLDDGGAGTSGGWYCADDTGGLSSAVVSVKEEGGSEVDGTVLSFNAYDFVISEDPADEIDVTIDYVNFGSHTTPFNIGDALAGGIAGAARAIDIGGNDTDLTNTIRIATEDTSADTLTIGNSNASTTIAITGGNDWSISAGGVITAATDETINGLDITAGALSDITGFSQASGAFSSTLTTTNSASFSSSTANTDSIAIKPQTSTATASFTGTLTSADLTANRTYTLQDADGTLAFLSDITSAQYDYWAISSDSNGAFDRNIDDTETLSVVGGEGIDTSIGSDRTLTIAGEDASTTNKGIASFNDSYFSVASGAVSIDDIYLLNSGDTGTGNYVFEGDLDFGNAASDTITFTGSIDSSVNFLDAATGSAYTVTGSDATGAGNAGGNLSVVAGSGLTTGAGGNLLFASGDSPAGTDGYIAFTTGGASGTERMRIQADGTFFFEKGSNDLTLSVTAPSGASRTATIPALSADDTFVFTTLAQTLSNKTLSAPTISGNVTVDLATNDLTLAFADQTSGAYTLTFPVITDNRTVCTTEGNCFGSGGGGVSYTSQTTNALTKFSSTAGEITSSSLLDDGTNLYATKTFTNSGTMFDFNLTLGADADTDIVSAINIDVTSANTGDADELYGININNLTSVDATVIESALRIGEDWQNLFEVEGSTDDANELYIIAEDPTADRTYTIPYEASDAEFCLSTGNCAGAGAGVTASPAGTGGQIAYFTAGQNITSESSSFGWDATTDALSIISAATTGSGLSLAADSITSGNAANIASASTAGTASGNSYLLNLSRSGTNSNASHTAYGISSSVTNTGTTSTNIAGYFSASGASTNYAGIFANGNVGIGDTSPAALLTVGASDAFQVSSTGLITAPTDETINGIDISAGAISDATYNGLGITTTSGTFTLTNSKTFVVQNTLTLAGTDGETWTFPDASGGTTGTVVGVAETQTLTNKTLTSPAIGTSILDTNGNALFALTATGSAVNYLTYANATAGNNPAWTATGASIDIGVNTILKAAGVANFSSTTANTDTISIKPQTSTATASFTGTLTSLDLTGTRTWSLPDEDGTICTTGSVCSGYQAAGSYDNYISWSVADDDTDTYAIASSNILRFTSSDGNVLTNLANGDDADENLDFTIRTLGDLVAGAGLTGGADDILIGADVDRTVTVGDGVGITVNADDIAFNATELDAITWSDNLNASNTWTFDISGTTDPTLTFSDASIATNSNLTLTKQDPTVIFNAGSTSDTKFWAGVTDDNGNDDDDLFQIGDGTTPGTNPFLTINTSGQVGIGDASPSSKLEIGDGTDSIQFGNTGDITFVDADGAASITGPAGGALTITSGAAQDLALTGADDIIFDDAQVTNIQLSDADTTLPNSNVGIVDAINDAYNAAVGTGAGVWDITTGVIHPGDLANDLAIGGSSLAASMFGIDESTGNFYFGYDNSANPTLNFEATDGDAGEFGFNTSDQFYITNANFDVSGHVALGANSAVNNGSLLYPANTFANVLSVQETFTDLTSTDYVEGITNYVNVNPALNATAQAFGIDTGIAIQTGNDKNLTTVAGTYSSADHSGTGTVNNLMGITAYASRNDGIVTNAYGVTAYAADGINNYGIKGQGYKELITTAGNNYGVHGSVENYTVVTTGTDLNAGIYSSILRTGATGGTLNTYGYYLDVASLDNAGAGTHNAYGIYLESVTGADTNYAIYSAGGQSYLAGNLGVGDTSPLSLFTVGNNDLFQINSSGIIAAIDGVAHTIDDVSGDLTLTSASTSVAVADDLAVNGATSADITSSTTTATLFNSTVTNLSLGGAATTLNIGPTGSGAGNIVLAGGSADTGCTLDQSNGNLTCSGNITGAAAGTVGYWTRTGTNLSPATAGDDILIPDSDTLTFGTGSDASITYDGTNLVIDPDLVGTGTVRIAGTEGADKFTITAGDAVISDGSLLLTDDDDAVSFGVTNNTATTIGAGVNTAGVVDLSSTSLTTGNLLNLETTTTLTSGKVLNIGSTSTALTSGSLISSSLTGASAFTGNLNLFNFSGAATATGDVVRINIGASSNVGKLFNVTDNGSTLFSVSESKITSALPHEFTSSGDVTMAYDLNFTNQTASYISSLGPLIIEAGETFESNDLTLRAYNAGDIIIDTPGNLLITSTDPSIVFDTTTATDTDFWAGVIEDAGGDDDDFFQIGDGTTPGTNPFISINTSGQVGIGDTSPSAKFEVGDGTDSIQVGDTGDITFVDADGAASITGPAGGALTIAAGTSQALTLTANGASIWSTTAGNLSILANANTANLLLGGGDTLPSSVVDGNDAEIRAEDDIFLNPTDDVRLYANGVAINCSTSANGGSLTTDANGVLTCSDDDDSGATITLQNAYDAGNTITTDATGNITFTLAELATPTTFEVFNQDTAGVSAIEIDNTIASGTLTNGLLIEQSGAGTMTSGIQILGSAGTITTGLLIADGAGAITTGIATTGTLTTGIDLSGASTTTDIILDDGLTIAQTSDNDLDIVENSLTLNLDFGEATASTITTSSASALDYAVTGDEGFTFTSSETTGTTTTSAFVFDATAITSGTGMYLTSDSVTTGKLGQIATTGNTLTTGTLLDVSSTATSITTGSAIANGGTNLGSLLNISLTGNSTFSGNIGVFDWSPTSATTATGNLLTLNVGTNGTLSGDIFQVQNAGSDLFSVNQNQITSALPHQFTAAGDVTMAYDLVFTNQTASVVKSYGPLTIESGESFENNNLNLTTYGTGAVIVDRKFSAGNQETLPVNDATPSVAAGNVYITANTTSTTTITNFDDGTAGQFLFIEINDAFTDFDCTSNANFSCGTTDLTAIEAGDNITWWYDGSTWHMIGWVDDGSNYSDGEGADLAELYVGPEDLESGDVVSIDPTQSVRVQKALSSDGQRVIGIVSTQPGVILDDGYAEGMVVRPVALAGRVPVKVSPASQAIAIGDLIGASGELGKAEKVSGGFIIGRALESWTPGTGQETIKVYVNPIFVNDTQFAAVDYENRIASLETDLNLVQSQLALGQESSSSATFTDLTVNQLTVLEDSVLSDTVINGKLNIGTIQIDNTENSIDAIGALKIQPLALGNVEFMGGLISFDTNGNIVAKTITAEKFKVAGASAGTGTLVAGGTFVDIETDLVTSGSLILVTPKSALAYPMAVTQKTDGVGFRVSVQFPESYDVEFDWFIVDKD